MGDGQNWIWSVWERHFKPHDFAPVLDFIHALTYLQNQQSRMDYPQYRRVKGTEKLWSERGAEAMLPLKTDTLSDTQPLDLFWYNRRQSMTGYRTYARAA